MGHIINKLAVSPLAADYCPCVCDLPSVSFMFAQRTAARGTGFETTPPAIAANVYSRAVAALAGYPAFIEYFVSFGGIFGGVAYSYTHYTKAEIADGVTKSTEGFSDTNDDVLVGGIPHLTAQVADCKYKLRVTFDAPFRGDTTFRVYWRTCTLSFTGSVVTYSDSTPPVFTEAGGDPVYEDFHEDVTPGEGDTEVYTSEYTVAVPAPGSRVYLVGPAAAGKWLSDVNLGSTPQRGLAVQSQSVGATRNGFVPYVRSRAHADDLDGAPVTAYATETATTRAGSAVAYSGAQTLSTAYRVYDPEVGGDSITSTFTPSVTSDYISQVDGANDGNGFPQDRLPTLADVIMPTRVEYNNGLIMTLSDPVEVSALTTAVDTKLATRDTASGVGGVDEPGQGTFAYRQLALSGLSYAVKKSRRKPYFECLVLVGIIGVPRAVSFFGAYEYHGLGGASGTVDIAVDTFSRDLDTGVESDTGPLAYSAAFALTAGTETYPGTGHQGEVVTGDALLSEDYEEVSVPSGNTLLGYRNWRVTTETLERLIIGPQVEVLADGGG